MLLQRIPPRLRQRPDRPAHRLVRDLDKPARFHPHLHQRYVQSTAQKGLPINNLVQPKLLPILLVDLPHQPLEPHARGLDIQRLIGGLAKDLGEVVGYEAAEHEVRICDC